MSAKIFSSKELKLYRAIDYRDIWHWWCVDNENNIIDLTKEQYTSLGKTPPYETARNHQCWVLHTEQECKN